MVEQSLSDDRLIAAPSPLLTLRRAVFFALVGATMAGQIALAVVALSPGGFGLLDFILVAMFAVTLPWYVIGFWNATIGLLIMRFARDPVAAVIPAAARVTGHERITASTAILVCIRNEPPERAAAFLTPLIAALAADESAGRFHVFILSDTDNPAVVGAEEATFSAI